MSSSVCSVLIIHVLHINIGMSCVAVCGLVSMCLCDLAESGYCFVFHGKTIREATHTT